MPPDGVQASLEAETEPAVLKRRSVNGAAVSFAGQALRVLFQFGSQLYMAHLISPSAFGLIAMVAPILRFVQLFNNMGLVEAVVQRPSITHRELSGLFWVNLVFSAVLALVFLASSPVVVWMYGEPRLPTIMACLAAILLLNGLAAQPMALLNRQMRFLPLTLIDVSSTASAAVVGVGMASLGFGYWSLVGLQLANSVTLCVLAWTLTGWRPSWPRWVPGLGSLLGFGGHITATSVVAFFAESFDKVLLGIAWGTLPLGLYDRSNTIVMMTLIMIMLTITRIAIPLLSRLVDSAERYRRTYLRMLQTSVLMIVPGLLCVILEPGYVVQILLGKDWLGAVPIIRIIAIGALVEPIIASMSWLFVSQGRARQQLLWGSVGFTAIAASFAAGLPWGPVGVATSWAACCWLVQAPVIVWAGTRSGPVRARDVIGACAPAAVAAVVASAALWLLDGRIQIDSPGELILAVLVSYGVHGIVLVLIPGGRQFLRDILALRSSLGETPL